MRSTAAYAYGRDRTLPAPREISLDRHKKHTQQTGTQRRFMHFPAANTGGVLQRLARRALLTARTRATTLPPRRTRRRHNRPTRQAKAAEQISPALNDENAPNGAQKGFLKEQTHPPRTKPRSPHPPLQTQTSLNTQKRYGATETAFKGGKRACPAQNAARRITLITNIAPPHTRGLHGTHPPFTA